MFENDYIMRLIHEIVRTLMKLVFHIDTEQYESVELESESMKEKLDQLRKLMNTGKIKEAETQLFQYIDSGDVDGLKVALLFYDELNKLDEDYLLECDYSHQNLKDGIQKVAKTYGYDGLVDIILMGE